MDAAADLVMHAAGGWCGVWVDVTHASSHDIPHPIGDPDEDEGLPGEDDDEDEDDDDDEEPMQV